MTELRPNNASLVIGAGFGLFTVGVWATMPYARANVPAEWALAAAVFFFVATVLMLGYTDTEGASGQR